MANSIWIIFLDTSGSMRNKFSGGPEPVGLVETGEWASKLEAAKELLIRRVSALRTPDVAIIQFASDADILFHDAADRFSEFEGRIRSLQAGGGTDLAAAFREAFLLSRLSDYRDIRVYVISDGLTDADQAEHAANEFSRIYPQSRVSVLLIDQTEKGNETAFRIASDDDVTYAENYSETSELITQSALNLVAREAATLTTHQRMIFDA